MKVSQFREVLGAAEAMHRGTGNTAAADALNEIAGLLAGHETKTVAKFAELVAKAAADGNLADPAR